MNRMGRRLTTSEFKQKVYDLVQDEYQVLGEYEKAHQKILMKHMECGLEYEVLPYNFKNGKRCPKCQKNQKTTQQFKDEVYQLVQDEYEVLGEYKTARQKILMKHRVCGHEYTSLPKNFLNGHRCPNCNKGRCLKNN